MIARAPASVFHRLPRGVLALVALLSLAALAIALVAQHAFGAAPCPWCIFQRVLYLAIALVAAIGWLIPPCTGTYAAAATTGALALGGIASAVFQHQVAARDSSCAFTFADRFLSFTGLETALPFVFQVTATCMDAAQATLLGLGYELWSGLLFAAIAIVCVLVLWHRRVRR